MSDSIKNFKTTLRELRLKKSLSQKELANAIGITPANISNYEAGKAQPRAETIAKIAEFFGVDTSTFFDALDVPISQDLTNLVSVPILNWIEASFADENFNFESCKQLLLDKNLFKIDKINSPRLFALEINSYSMYPKFIPGDMVIVDWADFYLKSGCVHILSGQFQEAIIRQCSLKLDGTVELISPNLEYPSYTYTVGDFKVVGKVVLKISKL